MTRSDVRRERDRVVASLSRHPWITKVSALRFLRRETPIGLASDLFSSASVDVGTERLLRLLARVDSPLRASPDGAALDLGCGAGPIGLAIAAAEPGRRVVLCDRDRIAVSVATRNLSSLPAETRASEVTTLDAGLDYVPARQGDVAPFDLIVTNIPAKVGPDGLDHLLFGAGDLLRPGGALSFVHVTPLAESIDAMLADRVERGLRVDEERVSAGKEHIARTWRLPDGLPAAADSTDPLTPYRRRDVEDRILLRNMPVLPHVAVHDVDEFDSLHYRTPLLLELLALARPVDELEAPEQVLVANPCHGFAAAMLVARREPASVALLSRDTLEETVARRNLDAVLDKHRYPTKHVRPDPHPEWPWLPAPAGSDGGYDVILAPVRTREGKEGVAETLLAYRAALRDGGLLLVTAPAGSFESLRKIAMANGLRVGRSLSRRGHAAAVLRRRPLPD